MKRKKLVILGGGESGVGAAILAQQKGYNIWLSDNGSIHKEHTHTLKTNAIPYEEGGHTLKKILTADEVVKSPGIPDHIPIIQQIKKKGIPVISEIEFAARFTNSTIIGITGSNGKTTTTNFTYHILKTAGLPVGIGGNVGKSFARIISEHTYEYLVLELSSFQLDGIVDFRPDIAIYLNVSPDHLDRYEYKMENYTAAKFRITMNQTEKDRFFFNASNKDMMEFMQQNFHTRAQKIPVQEISEAGDTIVVEGHTFDMTKSTLQGPHNFFNAHCAILAALDLGVDPIVIQKAINTFVNDPHRMEKVALQDGVTFINDSKATNVDAVLQALKSINRPIIWIAGGVDKGNDYKILTSIVQQKVKALICLGTDNEKLIEHYSPILKILEETKSAAEAVARARVYAEPGDVVLLSPACASFDLFKNYKDRGDQFKIAVLGIN